MRKVCLGLLFCATLSAQPASMEGIVINRATGQPMAGVHVRLLSDDFGYGALVSAYGAMSDRDGHFSVGSIDPGMYLLYPECTGFVLVPVKNIGNSVPVKPGQHVADYKIEMEPRATISGRVVDEFGDPVPNVRLELQALSPDAVQDLPFGFGESPTDDLGEFHLVAAPGRYYLQVSVQDPQQQSAPEIRTDGTSAAPYSSTYYPSAAAKTSATALEVASGQDLVGIEIHLRRAGAASGTALSISGTVTGAPGAEMPTVWLAHGEGSDERFLFHTSSTTVRPDGKFAFANLEPGAYRLFAQYDSSKPPMRSQWVDLTLENAGADGVHLILAPAEELTGVLELPGEAADAVKRTVRIETENQSNIYTGDDPSPATVGRDGAFHIANASPGRFRVLVDPLPENAYVQSVALDGALAPDGIVELTHAAGSSRLKITVKTDGAQVSGRVLDKDGQPTTSPLVMIFLATDAKQLVRMNPEDIHKPVDARYSFTAVRPGKYRLFAVDSASLAASSGDVDEADLANRIFTAGGEIEIKPGDRIVKDLKAIDKVPAKESPR